MKYTSNTDHYGLFHCFCRRREPIGTLLETKETLKSRGLEVNEEIEVLIDNRVDSLARLAFACCSPGEAPTNEQIDQLFANKIPINQGTYSSIKRLIFEAQTLLSAELQNKVHRTEEQTKAKMAPAERDNRIKDQRTKLEGLRLKRRRRVQPFQFRPGAQYA